MTDLEKEIKKVRDEAAQRRVELSPYKKAFENFDSEATNWLLETVELINTDPQEAGERFATLAVGNMGQDNFTNWASEFINEDIVDNNVDIGDNNKMDDNAQEPNLQGLEERLMAAIDSKNQETKEMIAEQERREQYKEINQMVVDLGYNVDSWQGKMLIQVASSEVDSNLDIGQRLSKADDIVRERIGSGVSDKAATNEAEKIQIGNAEIAKDPLNVPATGGQIGGTGVPEVNGTTPISFGDADDALMTLLRSEVNS
jgi:hypothetical protein